MLMPKDGARSIKFVHLTMTTVGLLQNSCTHSKYNIIYYWLDYSILLVRVDIWILKKYCGRITFFNIAG